MEKNQKQFDIAVIGGGPAGMMAAGRAAKLGARVVLIEKNPHLGRKLLMTGGGRCNFSHAGLSHKEFAEKLGKNGQFLLSALSVFGPEEIVKFFEANGLSTKTEKDGRIFPASDRAQDVLNVLLKYLKENKVKLMPGREVTGFNVKKGVIESVKLKDKEISARSFILSTGGKSYPMTGSVGDGYAWAKKMGHKIITPAPALTPIETKEIWVRHLQGLTLKNVEVALCQNGKKQETKSGEVLFTHFGLSGPIILNLSKKIGRILPEGEATIEIDLLPALDIQTLDKKLQEDFKGNKDFINYLPELVPQKLANFIARFAKVEPDKKLNSITKDERTRLATVLKGLKLTVRSLLGFEQAIITTGGVDLREIDSKTMRSKLIKNLSFAGEIMDLDGPTGGYNLQICWTTGYSAGQNAI